MRVIILMAIILVGGFVHLTAAYAGVQYHFGEVWAWLLIFVTFLTRFTLPATIATFFGAWHVWGWHWAGALLFAAPGLALFAPTLAIIGAIDPVLEMIKGSRHAKSRHIKNRRED